MTLCHGCVALRNDEDRRQNAPSTPGSVGETFRSAPEEGLGAANPGLQRTPDGAAPSV
jgi:hypothetical protein